MLVGSPENWMAWASARRAPSPFARSRPQTLIGRIPPSVLTSEMTFAEGLKHHGLDRPDVFIDAAGKEAVRDEAMALLAHRGVFVSVAHGVGLKIDSLYGDFVFREMTRIGSEYFACHVLEENYRLLKANREYLGQVITHRMGVDELQRAFELFWAGNTGKVVIEQ